MMIYQIRVPERGPLPEAVEGALSRGILIEFNMAFDLSPDNKAQLEACHRRIITGTLPFMARDLVMHLKRAQSVHATPPDEPPEDRLQLQPKGNSPKYDLYRYILIWAFTYYDLEKGKRFEPLAASELQYFNTGDAPM